MSNENEKSMGSGQPLEDKIFISRDEKEVFEYLGDDGEKYTKVISKTLELSLSESLRVIEATVKYLNQTKNEGRHEQRTIKDKENQETINKILQILKCREKPNSEDRQLIISIQRVLDHGTTIPLYHSREAALKDMKGQMINGLTWFETDGDNDNTKKCVYMNGKISEYCLSNEGY